LVKYVSYGKVVEELPELKHEYIRWHDLSELASYVIFKDNNYTVAMGTKNLPNYRSLDSSVVIQKAIDALASGGRIFIREGAYTINTKIISTNDDILLEGETFAPKTYGTRLINRVKDDAMLEFGTTGQDIKGLKIKNLHLDATGNPNVGSNSSLLKIIRANTRVVIEGLMLSGTRSTNNDDGLVLEDPIGVAIRNVTADYFATGTYAFYLYTNKRNSGNIILDNVEAINRVDGTAFFIDGTAVAFNNFVLINVKAMDLSFNSGSIGIHLKNVRNVVMLAPHIETYDTGILIDGSGNFGHKIISPIISPASSTISKGIDISTGGAKHISIEKLRLGSTGGSITTGIDVHSSAYDITIDTISTVGTITTLVNDPGSILRYRGYLDDKPYKNSGTASGVSPITIPQTTHKLAIDPTYVNAISQTAGYYVISASYDAGTKDITIEHSGGTTTSIDVYWEARA